MLLKFLQSYMGPPNDKFGDVVLDKNTCGGDCLIAFPLPQKKGRTRLLDKKNQFRRRTSLGRPLSEPLCGLPNNGYDY